MLSFFCPLPSVPLSFHPPYFSVSYFSSLYDPLLFSFSFFFKNPISCFSSLASRHSLAPSLVSSSPPSLPPLITECEGIDNRLLPYVAPWLMFSGLSRRFSFIAHVMAHKLIPKRDLPDDFHSKKKEGKRKRHSEGKILILKSGKGHVERGR